MVPIWSCITALLPWPDVWSLSGPVLLLGEGPDILCHCPRYSTLQLDSKLQLYNNAPGLPSSTVVVVGGAVVVVTVVVVVKGGRVWPSETNQCFNTYTARPVC